jgi:hypothetical protein
MVQVGHDFDDLFVRVESGGVGGEGTNQIRRQPLPQLHGSVRFHRLLPAIDEATVELAYVGATGKNDVVDGVSERCEMFENERVREMKQTKGMKELNLT